MDLVELDLKSLKSSFSYHLGYYIDLTLENEPDRDAIFVVGKLLTEIGVEISARVIRTGSNPANKEASAAVEKLPYGKKLVLKGSKNTSSEVDKINEGMGTSLTKNILNQSEFTGLTAVSNIQGKNSENQQGDIKLAFSFSSSAVGLFQSKTCMFIIFMQVENFIK